MENRNAKLSLVDQLAVAISGHLVGRVVGRSADGILVDYPGNPHGPLPARATLVLDAPGARGVEPEVLLVFEGERSDRPIIVGVLHKQVSVTAVAVEPPAADRPAPAPLKVEVDGKEIVVEGQDEVVLRCGKASITLRRNGRVVIRGTYIETRAEGVNRIKGGSVQIN